MFLLASRMRALDARAVPAVIPDNKIDSTEALYGIPLIVSELVDSTPLTFRDPSVPIDVIFG